MKNFIKKIPLIGWFLRLIYNILRINNLKFLVSSQQEQLQNQQEQLQNQQEQLQNLRQQQIQDKIYLEAKINAINDNIESIVTKEIYYTNLASSQRIDQFIFDSKIAISNYKPV